MSPLGAIDGCLVRSAPSREPPSRPKGGGVGRGKPAPEGEEGVVEEETGTSLDRLSPKGLAGF
eukprot:8095125-Pyramimonas_sp.AAC.1